MFGVPTVVCILLVEDEPLVLEVMGKEVRDQGYQVLPVGNDERAIALMNEIRDR